eukprot:GFYU01000786.1.p1 GENE.GFYU01000786.1~~GFYU01000786.1.p1  ORF type:complete len:264 (+),score=127.53 GFYU01000786.1:96-887(+)
MTDEKKEFTAEELKQKLAEVTQTSIEDQAKTFLRAFVLEFQGNFEEVLELAAEFKKYAPNPEENSLVRELDEHQAHIFLEKRGETATVVELRDALAEIDLDKNRNVAFIEYVLWKFHKNLSQLFTPPKGGASPEALAMLDKAIEDFQKVIAEREAREKKMEELKKIADGEGVKAMAAKNELAQLQAADQLEQNKREVTLAAAKRRAEKVVADDDYEAKERERALKAEEKRVAEEKAKKDADEAAAKEASRKRLADRAAAFEGK